MTLLTNHLPDYYIKSSNLNIVGVKRAVKMPFNVSPRLAYAPCLLLISIAVDVPTACAAVPIESPCAIGLPIFKSANI